MSQITINYKSSTCEIIYTKGPQSVRGRLINKLLSQSDPIQKFLLLQNKHLEQMRIQQKNPYKGYPPLQLFKTQDSFECFEEPSDSVEIVHKSPARALFRFRAKPNWDPTSLQTRDFDSTYLEEDELPESDSNLMNFRESYQIANWEANWEANKRVDMKEAEHEDSSTKMQEQNFFDESLQKSQSSHSAFLNESNSQTYPESQKNSVFLPKNFQKVDHTLLKLYHSPILFQISLLQLSRLCSSIHSANSSFSVNIEESSEILEILANLCKNVKNEKKKAEEIRKMMGKTIEVLTELQEALNELSSLDIMKRFEEIEKMEVERMKAFYVFEGEILWQGDSLINIEEITDKKKGKSQKYDRLMEILSFLESLNEF